MTNYIIVGTGGHGKVVLGYLERSGVSKSCIAFADIFKKRSNTFQDCPIVGDLVDGIKSPFDYAEVIIAYGGNAFDGNKERQRAAETIRRYSDFNFDFSTVIDPSAVIMKSAEIGKNVSIGIHSSVGAESVIHEGVIVNNFVNVEHDVEVRQYSNLSPNSVLLGGVTIGDCVFIGAGAVIRDDVTVHENSVVAMGSVVTKDIPSNTFVAGSPARIIRNL